MRVVHGKSEPGEPQSNGTMESMVKVLLGGTRVNLLRGAPNCFYIFGADHYAMSRNILYGGYKRLWGEDFPGLVIPFFAGVDYQPSATYQAATGRVEGRLRKGVFLGWAMNPGFD